MNRSMSKSSLPAEVLTRTLVGSGTSPSFLLEFAAWLLCIISQASTWSWLSALRIPVPCTLWSLCLHVLGETKAQTGTVVLSEWFPRPGGCCALVQPLYLGAVAMVEDVWGGKIKDGKWERLVCVCNRHTWGERVEGKGLQMQLFLLCSYLPCWQQPQHWDMALWEHAQSFNEGRQGGAARSWLSGALCVSRLSAFSEETHHHPALHWIKAFEVVSLICVTASVTQHKTFSVFFLFPAAVLPTWYHN